MEQLKHECGVALIRLLKPLNYYVQKYGTWRYGLDKLYLLMEKQHNRGQEGAGVACVNLDAPAGEEYMFRERAEGKDAITEVFKRIDKGEMTTDNGLASDDAALPNSQFSILNSQLLMGHCGIQPQVKAVCNMCIHFCVETIGVQRTSVCVVISI